MVRTDPKPLALRIFAVVLCVSVLVFLSAILAHHHGSGSGSHAAAHCQVCTLGHTTASVAAAVDLIVLMLALLLTRFSAPGRGSPSFLALPTTRPPPASR
jgi:hypothetical protein